MGNKPYTVVTDDNGKRSRIIVKQESGPDGIDFRRKSCYHDSRPKRQRTRGAQLRHFFESVNDESR